MEDMHIHLKDAINDEKLFEEYVCKCLKMHLNRVVFLDHGNRISTKHKPVLDKIENIDKLTSLINKYRKDNKKSELEIIKGIEIDYSTDLDFRNKTYEILNYGNFEWVVGAIHSLKFSKEEDYFKAIIDMLNNYDINVVAHLRLDENYKSYKKYIVDILKMCKIKNVSMEINTSDRSRWSDEQLYFMLSLMKKYEVKYVYSSDAHKKDEIGYMIEDTSRKVEIWNIK